jgi:hypothetical protein
MLYNEYNFASPRVESVPRPSTRDHINSTSVTLSPTPRHLFSMLHYIYNICDTKNWIGMAYKICEDYDFHPIVFR